MQLITKIMFLIITILFVSGFVAVHHDNDQGDNTTVVHEDDGQTQVYNSNDNWSNDGAANARVQEDRSTVEQNNNYDN